jgi:hypothetical protein
MCAPIKTAEKALIADAEPVIAEAVIRRRMAEAEADKTAKAAENALHPAEKDAALAEAARAKLGFCTASPEVGAEWTDDGTRREQRQLKARPEGEWRRVPTAPPLTKLLRWHLTVFDPGPERRVFAGIRGGELATITYRRAWDNARRAALSPAEYASPLARRVYDLRHACVSTWLNGGVPPAQVAEWAGHSVSVLLKVYAKCIEGQDETAKRRIEAALRA